MTSAAAIVSATKPSSGVGHYLRDIVYGASDGIVTTMAVIAGVAGAALPTRVALILGLANLAADGFSMGASNYLGLKSELEQTGESVAAERPLRHAAATFAAFVVAGAGPLAAFFFPGPRLWTSTALSVLMLILTGAARARFIGRQPASAALEMTAIGAIAIGAAYAIGNLARWATS